MLSNFNLAFLKTRSAFLQEVRQFLVAHDYLEVDSPALLPFAPPDSTLDALEVSGKDGFQGFLATSPEFGLKEYAAGREEFPELNRIFEICHSFRDESINSDWHSPEFRMLEWYNWQIDLTSFLQELQTMIQVLSTQAFAIKPFATNDWPFFSVKDFCLKNEIGWNAQDWAQSASALGFSSDSETELFSFLTVSKIEPALPKGWVWVQDYPAILSSLAQVDANQPDLCRRVELYYNGIEIANIYIEETNPNKLKDLWQRENQKRAALNKRRSELDNDFLHAQTKLHASRLNNNTGIGAALGLDRLLAVLTGEVGLRTNSPFRSVFRKND